MAVEDVNYFISNENSKGFWIMIRVTNILIFLITICSSFVFAEEDTYNVGELLARYHVSGSVEQVQKKVLNYRSNSSSNHSIDSFDKLLEKDVLNILDVYHYVALTNDAFDSGTLISADLADFIRLNIKHLSEADALKSIEIFAGLLTTVTVFGGGTHPALSGILTIIDSFRSDKILQESVHVFKKFLFVPGDPAGDYFAKNIRRISRGTKSKDLKKQLNEITPQGSIFRTCWDILSKLL